MQDLTRDPRLPAPLVVPSSQMGIATTDTAGHRLAMAGSGSSVAFEPVREATAPDLTGDDSGRRARDAVMVHSPESGDDGFSRTGWAPPGYVAEGARLGPNRET